MVKGLKFGCGGGMVTNGGEIFSWEADFSEKVVDFLKKGADFLGIFVLIFYQTQCPLADGKEKKCCKHNF